MAEKENYEPSEQEAEQHLTSDEERASKFRERAMGDYPEAEEAKSRFSRESAKEVAESLGQSLQYQKERAEKRWNMAERERGKSDYDEITERAEKRGERVLEVPITLEFTVKVPEHGVILDDEWPYVENAIYSAKEAASRNIQKQVRDQLKETDPELVKASVSYSIAVSELTRMRVGTGETPGGGLSTGEYRPSPLFDEVRAKQLYREVKAISKKYNCGTRTLDYIRESFESMDVHLDED